MSARLLSITAWLAAGHALLLALFWGLLHVPESNAAMLVLSALLAACLLALGGWVEGIGLSAWTPGATWRDAVRRSRLAPAAAVVAIALLGVTWLLTARAYSAWAAHRGEIDAWLLLHLGWTRTAGLHAGVGRVIGFARVVGGLLSATAFAWTLDGGIRALVRADRWAAAALAPRRLLFGAALFYGLVWLPWKAAYWRPASVAPNWQEIAFVGIKLALLYALANLGWAAILYLVRDGAKPDTTTTDAGS
jgi:hypothetical protein